MYPGAPPPTPYNYPTPPQSPRSGMSLFAKLMIGFAVLGFLSLGLCGVAIVSSKGGGNSGETLAFLSIGGMVLGFFGVVVTGVIWVIVLAINSKPRP